jgi:DNA-binding CsgD family transcriptional regulator
VLSFEKAAVCAVLANGEQRSMRHFVNHSYGTAWADLYTQRDYVAVDPVIQHALTVNGSFEWSDAFRSSVGASASEFLDAARDFRLGQGVSYTCRTAGTKAARTVLSLAVGDPSESARAKLVLAGVGPHVHEAYVRLCAQSPPDDCHTVLTAREKEVLNWATQGKTYWEIGRILGISQRTVKFHFANIRARLDAVSASHAVAKAMSMGLLA